MYSNPPPRRGRRGLVAAAVASCAGLVLLTALPAWGHGDVRDSSPAEGERLRRAPERVTVRLAEPPAQGSDLKVIDGCREQVSGSARIADADLVAPVTGGQPGRWQVRVRSLSSVDGHLVREAFSFRVRGQRDCSAEETPDDDDPAEDEVELADPPPPLQNEETSFPVVPFAIGTVVVVGVAIALRRPGRKS